MAAPNAGSGLILNTTVNTTGSVSAPVAFKQGVINSFQTRTAGTNIITVDIQASNVPALRDNYAGTATRAAAGGNLVRDDSYASLDWVVIQTNTMAAAAGSRMDFVQNVANLVYRVRVTASAGTNATEVYLSTQGWGS